MKKVLLIISSLVMIFSLAACSSTSSTTETETRDANDKSWPTKSDASFMQDVPAYSEQADQVVVEKTLISQNDDKENTYSEIIYIKYENETYENAAWYVYGLIENGFQTDESTFSDISGGKFYWGSISGLDTDAIDDYDLPFIEVTYDESAEYNFIIKICIF